MTRPSGLRGRIHDAKEATLDWMEDKTPALHRFFTADTKAAHRGRSVAGFAVAILLAVTLLWGGTGQALGEAPVVVIESGSMMHCDDRLGTGKIGNDCERSSFGRLGTIDPGDLVFVRDIDVQSDVTTMAADEKDHHGLAGDVIVFRPDGSESATPVIHRAMFWLEIHGDGTYSVPELGLERVSAEQLRQPPIHHHSRWGTNGFCQLVIPHNLQPHHSGFITKGDNNSCWDQGNQVSRFPIQPDWILGKARGEVPWIGLLKLWVFDGLQGTSNYKAAPGDLKAAMWTSVITLLASPYLIEMGIKQYRRRRGDDGVGPDDV